MNIRRSKETTSFIPGQSSLSEAYSCLASALHCYEIVCMDVIHHRLMNFENQGGEPLHAHDTMAGSWQRFKTAFPAIMLPPGCQEFPLQAGLSWPPERTGLPPGFGLSLNSPGPVFDEPVIPSTMDSHDLSANLDVAAAGYYNPAVIMSTNGWDVWSSTGSSSAVPVMRQGWRLLEVLREAKERASQSHCLEFAEMGEQMLSDKPERAIRLHLIGLLIMEHAICIRNSICSDGDLSTLALSQRVCFNRKMLQGSTSYSQLVTYFELEQLHKRFATALRDLEAGPFPTTIDNVLGASFDLMSILISMAKRIEDDDKTKKPSCMGGGEVRIINVPVYEPAPGSHEHAPESADLYEFIGTLISDLQLSMDIMNAALDEGMRLYPGNIDGESVRELEATMRAGGHIDVFLEKLFVCAGFPDRPVQCQQIDLSEMLRRLFTALADREGLESAIMDIQPGMEVQGDPVMVALLLERILDNAVMYRGTDWGLVVSAGCTDDGSGPVYYIKDNGGGFLAEQAELVFGPFISLHRCTGIGGHGLGLPVARYIAQQHCGQIWAEGRPGEGVCIYFRLQLAQAPKQ